MPPFRHRSLPVVALSILIATVVSTTVLTSRAAAGGALATNGTQDSSISQLSDYEAFGADLFIAFAYALAIGASLFALKRVGHELSARRKAALTARQEARAAENRLAAQSHERLEMRQQVEEVAEKHAQALSVQAALLEREQQARRDAEAALRLRDDFLATVSHELRTPLNAIIGWLHVLEMGNLRGGDTQRAIEAIARNARAQTRVVDDLLDVSRMMQGRVNLTLGRHDVLNIVSAAVDNFRAAAAAKHVGIALVSEGPGVHVSGDGARLQQAVRNLLSNALKFTPRDGHVDVVVARENNHARVYVADTGEGIETAFLPHVFEPFRQGASSSMRSGLGLGLTIVRELIELHGGSVVAESAGPGQGARFTVTLPLHIESEPGAASEDAGLQGVRILIAEDDDEVARTLRSFLGSTGCVVHVVGRGCDFVTELLDWQPQVVVCDVAMQDEDACTLLARARQIEGVSSVPAIALLTGVGEEERTRALAAGYGAQLTKPPDREALLREVMFAVKQHATTH